MYVALKVAAVFIKYIYYSHYTVIEANMGLR